ncbi:hypothetical protein GGF31_002034 [Allomyces arbusculus]|nr:hypothetical protein GGF31_002034 [Allomyces arbusculus]
MPRNYSFLSSASAAQATAHHLKRTFGVTFPWRYKDALPLPRLTHDDLVFPTLNDELAHRGPLAKMWAGLITKPLTYQVSQWVGERVLQNNLGTEYFPDGFLKGAYVAVTPALQALSYSPSDPMAWDKPFAKSIFTPEIHERFDREFTKLREMGDTGIELAVNDVHDARIKDIWVLFGPKRVLLANRPDPSRAILKLGTLTASAARSEDASNAMNALKLDLMEGIQIHIDVEYSLDCALTVYQTPSAKPIEDGAAAPVEPAPAVEGDDGADSVQQTVVKSHPVFHEHTARRELVLRFSSPYFEPSDTISQSGPGGMQERVWDWDWKISDIDYLLEAEGRD